MPQAKVMVPLGPSAEYQLHFKGLHAEHDSLYEHINDLIENDGLIGGMKPAHFAQAHASPAMTQVVEAYLEAGKLNEVERYHSGGFGFGLPHDHNIAMAERFVSMGQGARAVRMWFSYIASNAETFWWHVTHRDSGFKMAKFWAADEKTQRQEFEKICAKIPGLKDTMLKLCQKAAEVFARAGATDQDRARLSKILAEVEAEARTVPATDPRKMDDDVFWELIGHGLDDLPEALAAFKANQIKAFDKRIRTQMSESYRTDIWALAYILGDGCSDDSFDAFRAWLILQGRAVYEATLADPDGFDPHLYPGHDDRPLALLEVSRQAYMTRQGAAMPETKPKAMKLKGPQLTEDDFEAALPGLAQRKNAA
ncbi:MAG: DUF4240 domain-containing protein [Pseudomonadota bacterium]